MAARKRTPIFGPTSTGSTLTKLLDSFADMRHMQAIRETAERFGITENEVLKALQGDTFFVKMRSIPPSSVRRR